MDWSLSFLGLGKEFSSTYSGLFSGPVSSLMQARRLVHVYSGVASLARSSSSVLVTAFQRKVIHRSTGKITSLLKNP